MARAKDPCDPTKTPPAPILQLQARARAAEQRLAEATAAQARAEQRALDAEQRALRAERAAFSGGSYRPPNGSGGGGGSRGYIPPVNGVANAADVSGMRSSRSRWQ